MKTHPASRLLPLVCLAFCSTADAEGLVFAHDHLKFTSATTTYEMKIDKVGGSVKVVKEAIMPAPGELLRHQVTISVDSDGPHVFSLLTLGIQAVTHDTVIVAAPTGPAGVRFAPIDITPQPPQAPGAPQPPPPPAPAGQPIDPVNGLTIKATGYTPLAQGQPAAQRTVNADNVWFIIFRGKECKLIIKPLPDYVWTTDWTSAISPQMGHGTETPH